MEIPVIYGKVIYIRTAEKSLNGIKDFIKVYTHFFAFVTVNSKLIVRSTCIEEGYGTCNFRTLVGSCHEDINIPFKSFYVIIALTLLKLKCESSGGTQPWNGWRSYDNYICLPY